MMLFKNGIAIFSILFIKGICAHNLKDDVQSFFKRDGKMSHNPHTVDEFQNEILKIVESAPDSVQKLFQNFSSATFDDMIFLYPTIFTYIPDEKLEKVSSNELVKLFNRYNNDVGLVTKILRTLKNESKRIDFLSRLEEENLNHDIIEIITEELVKASTSREDTLHLLLQNRCLLLGASPSFLFQLKDVFKALLFYYVHYMSSAVDTNKFWNPPYQLTKRTWSKLMVTPNINFFRLKQEYSFDMYRHILEGMNLLEINNFLASNGESLKSIQSMDWNTVQIRAIFDNLKNRNVSLEEEFQFSLLPHLSPQQIQQMSKQKLQDTLPSLQTLDDLSLPTAIQLFEYFLTLSENGSNISSRLTNSMAKFAGKLLYSQDNTYFLKHCEELLSLKEFIQMDSTKYSLFQAHCILNYDELRSNDKSLFRIKELISAVPASFFINYQDTFKVVSEEILHHVWKYSPAGNRIRSMAFLELCSNEGYTEFFENALSNKNNEFLSLISPIDISKSADAIMKILENKQKSDFLFKERIANLPHYVLTELLRSEKNITYENLSNDLHPLHSMIIGLSCEILSKIPRSSFLPIFEFYNRQRKLFKKKFPKDLQNCAQKAFLRHLQDKSIAFTGAIDENLIQFMDLGDIRSIGGYVLTTLPVNVILRSKHCDSILREIGRLSLPELMLAASKDHLVSITSEYLKEKITGELVGLEYLLRLGNLIHFLSDGYLKNIDAEALGFILEAEVIDTRICASSEVREIWAKKLIDAFGNLETWKEDTVLKVGDMLIAIPDSSLNSINTTVRLNIADLVKSKYDENIEWIPHYSSFYEICCSSFLSKDECMLYESSIVHLVQFYAVSIENQLRNVLRANNIRITEAESFKNINDVTHDDENAEKEIFGSKSTENQLKSDLNLITNSNINREADREAETQEVNADITEKTNKGEPFLPKIFRFWFPEIPNPSSESDELRSSPTSKTISVVNLYSLSTSSESYPSRDTEEMKSDTIIKSNHLEPEILIPHSSISASPSSTLTMISSNADLLSVADGEHSKPPTVFQSSTVQELEKNRISTKNFNEKRTDGTLITSESITTEFNSKMSDLNVTISTAGVQDPISRSSISKTETSVASSTEQELNSINYLTKSTNASGQLVVTAPYDVMNETDIMLTYSKTERDHTAGIVTEFAHSSNGPVALEDVNTVTSNQGIAFTSSVEPATQFRHTTPYTKDSKILDISSVPSTDSSDIGFNTFDVKNRTRNVQLDNDNDTKPSKSNIHISDENLVDLIGHIVYRRSKRELNVKFSDDISISCNTLKILGSMSKFLISSLSMTDDDYFNCVELFGQLNLEKEMKVEIWSKVKSKVFDSNFTFIAGGILPILTETDYEDINFNLQSEWALELLHSISENDFHNLDDTIAARFMRQNSINNAKKILPSSAVLALGKLICNLGDHLLRNILKDSYTFSRNWLVFHTLNNCPMECLKIIAIEAIEKFGKPQHWNASVFTMLGPAAAGLFEIEIEGELNFTQHLHMSAIECLSSENINKLINGEQLGKIPLTSSMFVIEKQNKNCVTKRPCTLISSFNTTKILENLFKNDEKIVENKTSDQNCLYPSLFLLGILYVRFLL